MKNIKNILILAIATFCICGCSSVSLQKENESLQAKLEEVESEYNEYKELMQEYDGLAQNELEIRKFQAEQQKAYIKAVEESQAIEESKRIEQEEKIGFDTGITFFNLERMPDEYKNKKVKFYGKVVQVIEGDNEVDIRMSTKAGDYNFWFDDIIYGYYDPKMPHYRILEGDLITIYGISKGLYTYTSTEDKKITLPLIEIVKVDQQMN